MNATRARIEAIAAYIKAALKPAEELKPVKTFYYYPAGENSEKKQLFNQITVSGFEGLQDGLEADLREHKPDGMICESEMNLLISQSQALDYAGNPANVGETILSMNECISSIGLLLEALNKSRRSICNSNKINRGKCFVLADKVYLTNDAGEISFIGDLFSEKQAG